MHSEPQNIKEVATDVLSHIQYNFIHCADCLREVKNEKLAVNVLDFLTAITTISMGESQFIPILENSTSKRFYGHGVCYAGTTVEKFLTLKQELLTSLNTLNSKFTSDDKIILEDNFKKIEDNKDLLASSPSSNFFRYFPAYSSDIKSDPFLKSGKYKQKQPYGESIHKTSLNNNFQSAYLFPCFQSFCIHYQNERGNFSKIAKLISHNLFYNKSRSREMHELIKFKNITTFREVIHYVFNHEDHNNRSAQVLKKYYDIDFHIPEILELLENTSFPKDVNKMVLEYLSP